MKLSLCAAILSLATPVAAGDFSLALPVDCTLGKDCFIQQYVDRDPGDEAVDFTCGPLTYDGHKGTDFALTDLAAMHEGVAVLAAADGIVRGLRDGEPDTGRAQAQEGKECGNGVVIDHGGGWVTQYCHLKNNSIAVVANQRVTTGAHLGLVGLSGRTEFPHLHVSVRHNDQVVDPFASGTATGCGAASGDALWSVPISYQPGGLVSFELSQSVPAFSDVKAGALPQLTPQKDTPALVLVAHIFGARAGDVLTLRLAGPHETVFAREIQIDKTQARSFRAFGRKRPGAGWAQGSYKGSAILTRGTQEISRKSLAFEVR